MTRLILMQEAMKQSIAMLPQVLKIYC